MKYLITAEFLHKNKNENESATKINFPVVHLLAKQGKPFTNSGLIK